MDYLRPNDFLFVGWRSMGLVNARCGNGTYEP